MKTGARWTSGFAALEPKTNPDSSRQPGGQFASQLGTNPGVLGIFDTDFSNGPLECAPGGTSAPPTLTPAANRARPTTTTSHPEEADSAWKVPIAQADCSVDYPAVAGGPSGFGVLENNPRRTTSSTTASTKPKKLRHALRDDRREHGRGGSGGLARRSGGIYTTFLLDGGGGPISLAYSSAAARPGSGRRH